MLAMNSNPRRNVFLKSLIPTALCLALLAGLAGCNSKDTTAPTASIGSQPYSAAATSRFPTKPEVNLYPKVKVHTSAGEFVVKLDRKLAPLSVDNFLLYASTGQYNGTIFHQVYDGFILLGGGYDTQFNLRPTEAPVHNEAQNGLRNRRGTIAMARQADAINSATSQFFINLADNTALDHLGDNDDQFGYCVFGEVVSGMDVIEQISKGKTHDTAQFEKVPLDPIVIESVQRMD